jgi:hypothetical protein
MRAARHVGKQALIGEPVAETLRRVWLAELGLDEGKRAARRGLDHLFQQWQHRDNERHRRALAVLVLGERQPFTSVGFAQEFGDLFRPSDMLLSAHDTTARVPRA